MLAVVTNGSLELRLENGTRPGGIITVTESPSLIGRDQAAHVFLDDPGISRIHAALIFRDNQWILQDLGGVNPPLVHGRSASSIPLLEGDEISLGSLHLRVLRVNAGGPGEERTTLEIPARRLDAPLHRAQQLAGGRLWTVLEDFTAMLRQLDQGEDLVESALDGIMKVIPADRGGIYELDETGCLRPLATRNLDEHEKHLVVGDLDYSETVVARAVRDREAKLFAPETDGAGQSRSRSMIRKKIRNALCVPIAGTKVRGVLYLDCTRTEGLPLLPDDLELGRLLGALVAEFLDKAESFRSLDQELVQLRHREKDSAGTVLVGESAQIKEVRRRIRKVASTDVTALVTGESGTGKELVSRAVHELSDRSLAPRVAINCAAIPDTLIESELFGYVANSGIQGSDPQGKEGRFEMANGGTLVLDEVGELPLPVQAKLLRVLEEFQVDRIGGREPIPVDVRVIAMTNRDLQSEVQAGKFREDLYFRLNVFHIHIPPLRERTEDVLGIAEHLLKGMVSDREGVTISPRAKELLQQYDWPGNVRELRNVLLRAVLSGDGKSVTPRDLGSLAPTEETPFQPLRDLERHHIDSVLAATRWNKKKAAEILGIHRSTLYEKIREHGLSDQ